jgi:lipopolysaccharide export LptBFGC system permease protein LptF
MQVILIIVFFLVAIPLALKFPKIVKAIFSGVFSFIVYFIKNAPKSINEKRRD